MDCKRNDMVVFQKRLGESCDQRKYRTNLNFATISEQMIVGTDLLHTWHLMKQNLVT